MPHRSNSGSTDQSLVEADPGTGLLNETEYTNVSERVSALSKEADDVRAKIQELENKYDTTKMTAKQHDKLVKQYLLKLFDVNRELLPLKERIRKDAEEREKQKIREKLQAMGVDVKTRKRSKKTGSRKVPVAKVKHKRKNAKR